VLGVLHVRQHVGEQQVQGGVDIARPIGRRAGEPLMHGAGVGGQQRRPVRELLPVVDDRVEDAVPEAPELLGRQRQRRPVVAQLSPSNSSAREFMQ
jgi:hypothetical protein